MVLQQLQGTLDFERGGEAARQFEQFYNLMRAKLLEAQMRGSPELMQQQIRYMSEVRDCWTQAQRILQPKTAVSAVTAAPAAGATREREVPEANGAHRRASQSGVVAACQ